MGPRKPRKLGLSAASALLVLALASDVTGRTDALPQPHATFDPRASSIVLSFDQAYSDRGDVLWAGYISNFSSTSGNLSSQFGVHYLRDTTLGPYIGNGLAASAMTHYSVPLGRRWDNGVPRGALVLFGGPVPAVVAAGIGGWVQLPMSLGAAIGWSPLPGISLHGWAELLGGVRVEARAEPLELIVDVAKQKVDETTRVTDQQVEVTLTAEDVEEVVNKAVRWQWRWWTGWRAGLNLKGDMGRHAEVNLRLAFSADPRNDLVTWFGATLVYRWDDIVPAVLPIGRLLRKRSRRDRRREREVPNPFGDVPPPPALPRAVSPTAD